MWGGLPDCKHVWGDEISVHKGGPTGETSGLTNRGANQARTRVADIRAGRFCQQCGAWVGTLGLEPDYRMYVDHMVEVMELVRQVLADDGTLWLNLGSSYASGDMSPIQSRHGRRVPACDSDGKELEDSPGTDFAYSGLCDECRAASLIHTDMNQPPQSTALSRDQIVSVARLDSDAGPLGASALASPASTNQRFFGQPPVGCSRCGNCGACLAVLRSSSRDARACVCRDEYTSDTALRASESRNLGTDAVGMAWLNYKIKAKDMIPTPWMVAMALQANGWYLRQDIIWSKPSPMPESIRDRCTKSHEYIFLLSKQPRYYYDFEAMQEPVSVPQSGHGCCGDGMAQL